MANLNNSAGLIMKRCTGLSCDCILQVLARWAKGTTNVGHVVAIIALHNLELPRSFRLHHLLVYKGCPLFLRSLTAGGGALQAALVAAQQKSIKKIKF